MHTKDDILVFVNDLKMGKSEIKQKMANYIEANIDDFIEYLED